MTIGTWKSLPTSHRYRWLRCATAAATKCTTIANQPKAIYTIRNADPGQFLRASVVAVNLNGASTGAPTQVSAQIPTSAFTVTRPTITYQLRVPGGGAVQIACRLPYASRRPLRFTSLSMTIVTLEAVNGPLVTRQQSLRVPPRLFPWRAAEVGIRRRPAGR